jgi:hypothetical protein
MKSPLNQNKRIAVYLVSLILSLVGLVVILDLEKYFIGYHLGDIAYAVVVYLTFNLILSNKFNPKLIVILSISFLIILEIIQLIGVGTFLQGSNNVYVNHFGKYIIGTQFNFVEIAIYVVTIIVFNYIFMQIFKYHK